MAESTTTTKYHQALTVTNIKNVIPVVLDMEKSQYSLWAGLFKIHCRAYNVLDHIIPTTPAAPTSDTPDATYTRIDSIVLQRIYSTISNDLLNNVYETDSTAAEAWKRLQNTFQDNKNTRALYLQRQFSNITIDKFSSVAAYCQELKVLADQLTNVGDKVSDDRLVLQLVASLKENYDAVASYIAQCNPLPKFYEARSKLILEETRKSKQNPTINIDAALIATTNSASSPPPAQNPYRSNNYLGSGKGNSRGRSNTSRGR